MHFGIYAKNGSRAAFINNNYIQVAPAGADGWTPYANAYSCPPREVIERGGTRALSFRYTIRDAERERALPGDLVTRSSPSCAGCVVVESAALARRPRSGETAGRPWRALVGGALGSRCADVAWRLGFAVADPGVAVGLGWSG
jgi:hypothetical protein